MALFFNFQVSNRWTEWSMTIPMLLLTFFWTVIDQSTVRALISWPFLCTIVTVVGPIITLLSYSLSLSRSCRPFPDGLGFLHPLAEWSREPHLKQWSHDLHTARLCTRLGCIYSLSNYLCGMDRSGVALSSAKSAWTASRVDFKLNGWLGLTDLFWGFCSSPVLITVDPKLLTFVIWGRSLDFLSPSTWNNLVQSLHHFFISYSGFL